MCGGVGEQNLGGKRPPGSHESRMAHMGHRDPTRPFRRGRFRFGPRKNSALPRRLRLPFATPLNTAPPRAPQHRSAVPIRGSIPVAALSPISPQLSSREPPPKRSGGPLPDRIRRTQTGSEVWIPSEVPGDKFCVELVATAAVAQRVDSDPPTRADVTCGGDGGSSLNCGRYESSEIPGHPNAIFAGGTSVARRCLGENFPAGIPTAQNAQEKDAHSRTDQPQKMGALVERGPASRPTTRQFVSDSDRSTLLFFSGMQREGGGRLFRF